MYVVPVAMNGNDEVVLNTLVEPELTYIVVYVPSGNAGTIVLTSSSFNTEASNPGVVAASVAVFKT